MINCTFEKGNSSPLRHVVTNCIVTKGDEVLLVRRSSLLEEGGKWALPGGFMDMNETLIEAARREVLEETGWELEGLSLLTISDNPGRPGTTRQTVDIIYTASATRKSGEADWESEEVRWFAIDDLPDADEMAYDHLDHLELYVGQANDRATIPSAHAQ